MQDALDSIDLVSTISTVDDAAKFIRWYLANIRKEPPISIPSLSSCKTLLEGDTRLFEQAKIAHELHDYSCLDESETLHRNRLEWSSQFEDLREVFAKVTESGRISRILKGEPVQRSWELEDPLPDDEGESEDDRVPSAISAHIKDLRIPQVRSGPFPPPVILYQLGSFQNDGMLAARLRNIFREDRNVFLVNSSGTGKTRLLFEGLCSRWGFYFTSATDASGLGEGDIHDILQTSLEITQGWIPTVDEANYLSSVQLNIAIAHRRLSESLLARLLLFKLFISHAASEGINHRHKQQWLNVQLQPHIYLDSDKNGSIYESLMYTEADSRVIDDAIARVLSEINGIWDLKAAGRIFVVLDEANVASNAHLTAFRNEGGRYPILKEIIRNWNRHLKHLPVTFVVAGTEIPRNHFVGDEWEGWQWCSDTGSFSDPSSQQAYIAPFLPPGLTDTSSGKALVERSWKWLRGRHRFTASFMSSLIDVGFRSPHTILTKYVELTSTYKPCDADSLMKSEDNIENDKFDGLNISRIRHLRDGTMPAMHYALVHTICCLKGPQDLSRVHINVVTHGYGRFIDPDMSIIAVDEPLVLAGTANLFSTAPLSITDWKYFKEYTRLANIEVPYFAALCIALYFEEAQAISQSFSFPLGQPAWQAENVTVGVSDSLSLRFSARGHVPLVIRSHSAPELTSWLRGTSGSPFCIHATASGPILIFTLRLSNGHQFQVFLQTFGGSRVSSNELDSFLEASDPEASEKGNESSALLEALKSSTKTPEGLGPYGILPVIFLPNANSSEDQYLVDYLSKKQQTVAVLNSKSIQTAMASVDQSQLLDDIVSIILKDGEETLADDSGPIATSTTTGNSPKAKGARSSRGRGTQTTNPKGKARAGKGATRAAGQGTTVAKASTALVEEEGAGSSSRSRKRKVASPVASTSPSAPEEGSAKAPRYATRSVTKRLGG